MTDNPIASEEALPPAVSDPPEEQVWATGLLTGTLIARGITVSPLVDVNDRGDMITSRLSVLIAPELRVTIEVLGATNG